MKTKNTTTIFVTKYALTTGIFEKVVDMNEAGLCSAKEQHGVPVHYHVSDYELNMKDAIDKVEKIRLKKIESLKKSIKRLEDLKFE